MWDQSLDHQGWEDVLLHTEWKYASLAQLAKCAGLSDQVIWLTCQVSLGQDKTHLDPMPRSFDCAWLTFNRSWGNSTNRGAIDVWKSANATYGSQRNLSNYDGRWKIISCHLDSIKCPSDTQKTVRWGVRPDFVHKQDEVHGKIDCNSNDDAWQLDCIWFIGGVRTWLT